MRRGGGADRHVVVVTVPRSAGRPDGRILRGCCFPPCASIVFFPAPRERNAQFSSSPIGHASRSRSICDVTGSRRANTRSAKSIAITRFNNTSNKGFRMYGRWRETVDFGSLNRASPGTRTLTKATHVDNTRQAFFIKCASDTSYDNLNKFSSEHRSTIARTNEWRDLKMAGWISSRKATASRVR